MSRKPLAVSQEQEEFIVVVMAGINEATFRIVGIGGREGMASPKEREEIREEPFGFAQGRPFGRFRVDILRWMSKALASHGESIAKVNGIDK